MACIINASTSNGLVNSADGSGIVKLQSNGVATNALAWVNFNGTGTVAIRSSYNVSSITDNGTGDYTVNFATALSDANYAFTGTAKATSSQSNETLTRVISGKYNVSPTTTALRVVSATSSVGLEDYDIVNVAVFGN